MNAPLNSKEIEALLSLCWMAAHADGTRNEAERAEIKRLTSMVTSDPVRHDLLYTDVVAGIKTLEDLVGAITTPAVREKAYEMSACVCGSDKEWSKKERAFLEELRQGLGLDKAVADRIDKNVQLIFDPPPAPVVAPASPVVPPPAAPTPAPVPAAPVVPAAAGAPAAPKFAPLPAAGSAATPKFQPISAAGAPPAKSSPADIDAVIRKTAILAGALESVADPMCNMAVPLVQKRLVARVAGMQGHPMDKNQGMELMQAAGLPTSAAAASSASTEGAGGYLQKLFGGLLKKTPDASATKSGFANTMAIGQLAKLYYGGNKVIATEVLKDYFTTLASQAKPAQEQAAAEIAVRARDIVPGQVGDIIATI